MVLLVLFGGKNCGVCQTIKPQIDEKQVNCNLICHTYKKSKTSFKYSGEFNP
jgi:hypothetical protein